MKDNRGQWSMKSSPSPRLQYRLTDPAVSPFTVRLQKKGRCGVSVSGLVTLSDGTDCALMCPTSIRFEAGGQTWDPSPPCRFARLARFDG
ncbi:hypothetical protein BD324DRAFT_635605 [Kockovaella imperatae]|uniref:Uncharacterized protein n=1 Tax=Kockovaella imperatae TaxID=4999 RepID=A0A1Y1U8N4_9TREE|nr:hypothetical protein BD324DRAFT_635605 [Kockovaella imperatae]ORX34378.1 hypothetical protein BD324DRAFT_635605 [Kockovaella imperatae]